MWVKYRAGVRKKSSKFKSENFMEMANFGDPHGGGKRILKRMTQGINW